MIKRTPIEGLEWILEHDKFGFGENWTVDSEPQCKEEFAGYYIQRAIDELKERLEQITPVKDAVCKRIWRCGNCGTYVGFEDNDPYDPNDYDNYCHKCGKPVNWKEVQNT